MQKDKCNTPEIAPEKMFLLRLKAFIDEGWNLRFYGESDNYVARLIGEDKACRAKSPEKALELLYNQVFQRPPW
jgi:hypothetical protein